jgi:hypothetical protein
MGAEQEVVAMVALGPKGLERLLHQLPQTEDVLAGKHGAVCGQGFDLDLAAMEGACAASGHGVHQVGAKAFAVAALKPKQVRRVRFGDAIPVLEQSCGPVQMGREEVAPIQQIGAAQRVRPSQYHTRAPFEDAWGRGRR